MIKCKNKKCNMQFNEVLSGKWYIVKKYKFVDGKKVTVTFYKCPICGELNEKAKED